MDGITSSISGLGGSGSYVPAARGGFDTASKEVRQGEADRSTAVEDKDERYVEAAGQKAQIDSLENRIETKEQETKQAAKSEDELSRLEQQLEDLIEKFSKNPPNIRFSHSETSSGQVIDVIDSKTNETIRQIPSEEAIAIREHLQELNDMFTHAKSLEGEGNTKAKSILLDTNV